MYTVHDRRDGAAYSLRQTRTALVAFVCEQDAFTMSRALEHYAVTHGEYPPHDLDQDPNALRLIGPAPPSLRTPKTLQTRRWNGADDLADVCQANGLNVLLCQALDTRPHVAIQGAIIDCGQPTPVQLAVSLARRFS